VTSVVASGNANSSARTALRAAVPPRTAAAIPAPSSATRPPGSYLAISDTTRDIDTERVSGTTAQLNTRMGPARMTLRSRDEIAGFLDGLELVDPGLVPLPQWRALASPSHVIPCYAAIARKP
jgi:hypothetical protein